MSEIVIPIPQMIDFTKDFNDVQYVKVKRRTYTQMEKLIDKIYDEMVNAQMNGFEPSYVILRWDDAAFLNAYFKYHKRDFYHYVYQLTPELITQIFGLKIIVSNVRKPKVGW